MTTAVMTRPSSLPPAASEPADVDVVQVIAASVDQETRQMLTAAAHADTWDGSARARVLKWVSKHRDALTLLESTVLTAERAAGTWALHGDRDLAGYSGRTSHQGRNAGVAAVGQAATLEAMPIVGQALVDGPVTGAHVAQLTNATKGSPELAAQLATPEGQAKVVDLARRFDGGEFGKQIRALSASVDPAALQRQHDQQRANRYLHWSHGPGGTVIKGQLDSVTGHAFAKAIDALSPRPSVDDERSREQRHADALVTMVEHVLTNQELVPSSVAPVQAVVILTEQTMTALCADTEDPTTHADKADDHAGDAEADDHAVDAEADAHADKADDHAVDARDASSAGSVGRVKPAAPGSAIDVMDRLRGVPAVTDESGLPWPASQVARAWCHCALTRAVLGAKPTEVNLGRTQRLFGRRHWLALYAAGVRTCMIPGCGMPLAYCELHHIRWWKTQDGRTDLDNCAAYCSFHHHQVHRLGILVTRNPDGTLRHRHPDGRCYGDPTPRASASDPGVSDVPAANAAPPTNTAPPTDAGARMDVGQPMNAGMPTNAGVPTGLEPTLWT